MVGKIFPSFPLFLPFFLPSFLPVFFHNLSSKTHSFHTRMWPYARHLGQSDKKHSAEATERDHYMSPKHARLSLARNSLCSPLHTPG